MEEKKVFKTILSMIVLLMVLVTLLKADMNSVMVTLEPGYDLSLGPEYEIKEIQTDFRPKRKRWEEGDSDRRSRLVMVRHIEGVSGRTVKRVCESQPGVERVTLIEQKMQAQAIIIEKPPNNEIEFAHPLNTTPLHLITRIPVHAEVIVAVVDSGINTDLPIFEGAMWENEAEANGLFGVDDDGNGLIDDINGWDFTDYCETGGDNDPSYNPEAQGKDHGTAVAGIIGARRDYTIADFARNYVGINPSVKIMNLKRDNGDGEPWDAGMAIRYAVDMGATVINCSFGFFFDDTNTLQEAVEYALENDVIVIGSAGNVNANLEDINLPGTLPGVIGVTSFSRDETERGQSSSYGKYVDFASYGTVWQAQVDGNYTWNSGTSYSAAVISGIASRIRGNNPSLSKDEVVSVMADHAVELLDGGTETGYGKIDIDHLVSSYGEFETRYIELDLEGIEEAAMEVTIWKELGMTTSVVLDYLYVDGARYTIHDELHFGPNGRNN